MDINMLAMMDEMLLGCNEQGVGGAGRQLADALGTK